MKIIGVKLSDYTTGMVRTIVALARISHKRMNMLSHSNKSKEIRHMISSRRVKINNTYYAKNIRYVVERSENNMYYAKNIGYYVERSEFTLVDSLELNKFSEFVEDSDSKAFYEVAIDCIERSLYDY